MIQENELGVPAIAMQYLQDVQKGWLRLANIKKDTFDELLRFELKVQADLRGIEGCTLTEIQEKIKAAKSTIAEMKDCRLRFTRLLDERIIGPSMEFEKRSEALLTVPMQEELRLRILATEKAKETEAFDREVAQFKAHIINEYYRIAAEYRGALSAAISRGYIEALELAIPPDEVGAFVEVLKSTMGDIQLQKFDKFPLKLISKEKAGEIFATVPPYAGQIDDFKAAKEEANTAFSMYANDLANATAAIKCKVKETEIAIAKAQEALQIETATNVLVANAQPLTIDGAVTVRRAMQPVMDNSEGNAIAIVAGFMKNWTACRPYVRVRSWSKLTIGQMAEALGKLITDDPDVKIMNIVFTETFK